MTANSTDSLETIAVLDEKIRTDSFFDTVVIVGLVLVFTVLTVIFWIKKLKSEKRHQEHKSNHELDLSISVTSDVPEPYTAYPIVQEIELQIQAIKHGQTEVPDHPPFPTMWGTVPLTHSPSANLLMDNFVNIETTQPEVPSANLLMDNFVNIETTQPVEPEEPASVFTPMGTKEVESRVSFNCNASVGSAQRRFWSPTDPDIVTGYPRIQEYCPSSKL